MAAEAKTVKKAKKKAKKKATAPRAGRPPGAANRPIPSAAFEESEAFARSVFDIGSGKPVRRLTLFNEIGKSPESSASRLLITNAGKYGLIKGGYQAELIEPTPDAITIFDERQNHKDRARARVKLAIDSVPVFSELYAKLKELRLPARAALLDAARESGVGANYVEEVIDTLLLNLRSVGLLKNLSGAERIITVDHMLDSVPSTGATGFQIEQTNRAVASESAQLDFDATCFYITPIGDEGTEFRKHSDLFLSHIVEPALEQFQLTVVRADRIGEPGIISRQIFEYIMRSRLVVVDLSFHNPNVFYELAVRHMLKKPVVQISRVGDRIPFDVNQMRTVIIDNTDIYALVPKLEIFRSEIASHVRRALDNQGAADNPISAYYPGLEIVLQS